MIIALRCESGFNQKWVTFPPRHEEQVSHLTCTDPFTGLVGRDALRPLGRSGHMTDRYQVSRLESEGWRARLAQPSTSSLAAGVGLILFLALGTGITHLVGVLAGPDR